VFCLNKNQIQLASQGVREGHCSFKGGVARDQNWQITEMRCVQPLHKLNQLASQGVRGGHCSFKGSVARDQYGQITEARGVFCLNINQIQLASQGVREGQR
jgi:hypothetical protein